MTAGSLSLGRLAALAAAGLASASASLAAPASPTPSATALSPQAQQLVGWVRRSADNGALPFLVVDKIGAEVLAFDRKGDLVGRAPALLGLAQGDESVPGIGRRKLASIQPHERTTPAGRFPSGVGRNLGGEDVLWIDYEAAVSLHRVIPGASKDRRQQRLNSASPLDNRISYGCINVPAAFYDTAVMPAFSASGGIVYVLPEQRPLLAVFPSMTDARPMPPR